MEYLRKCPIVINSIVSAYSEMDFLKCRVDKGKSMEII